MREIALSIVLLTPPILVAVTFHEIAHGYVAYRLGDPTAKMAGRLTLNPFKHLDIMGTLVFLITRMIGWAKPVPVNPMNLRNPKKDMIWVSVAGPGANILIAILSALLYRIILSFPIGEGIFVEKLLIPLGIMLRYSIILNIGLALFNLIPVPPLDGSKILLGMLPHKHALAYSRIEPYGFLILLGLIILKIPNIIIFPVISFFSRLLI